MIAISIALTAVMTRLYCRRHNLNVIRPKGMHDRTFSRLLRQLIEARGRAFPHIEAWLDAQYRRDKRHPPRR